MSEPIPHSDGVPINDQDKRLLPPGEREKRESYFRDIIGLSQDKIDRLKEKHSSLYSTESIIEKVNGLKDRGFTNPTKMIESLPAILDLNFDNIDAKTSGLKDRGFTNPNKMIESSPQIFSFAFANIDTKISGLKDRGFTNPTKMIETLPAILGLNFDNIDAKISGLKDRGFTNPNKTIESSPQILGLAFENIDAKISGLKDRGFTNPNKTIESSPQILGLAFENIDAKINLLSKLTNLYQLNLNPVTTIESNPTILSVKLKKLIVITRVLRDYQSSPEDIQRKVSSLYKINLESLLISYSQKEPNDNIDNLIRTARQIQKQKLSKDYKRQLIKDFFNQNTDSYKIYREYLKGYPEKTQND